MSEIVFDQVSLGYPLYNQRSMSLRNQLLRVGTGGVLAGEAGKVQWVQALEKVSFRLQPGDAIGLVGHNGAGKSTLLRAMAGIYSPSHGRIRVRGRVSTVFDIGAGMDPELSGYENIVRMLLMTGLKRSQAKQQLPFIEEFTDLGDFLALPVRTYSSGMTMRLMFAVATAVQPEILLVDEMFAAGDQAFQIKAQARIRHLVANSEIFVFASHDFMTISALCKRVMQMNHGQIEIVSLEEFDARLKGLENQQNEERRRQLAENTKL